KPMSHDELGALPGAVSVREEDGRFFVDGTDETVKWLLPLFARDQVIPDRLRIAEASLDEVFLNLTNHEETPEPAHQEK
ncbi:hypothetical protein ACFQ07_08560, partial [Actinomadura adrarensis]